MAEYAAVSIFRVAELDIFTYWALLHDAIVYNYGQTKEGRKWLRNAWRLTQTEPETARLKKKYGKEG